MWTVFDITPTYVVCIYILWDVPLDMPCNIGTGHIGRICCRVMEDFGSVPERTDIIDKRRDSIFFIRITSIKKIEQMFALVV